MSESSISLFDQQSTQLRLGLVVTRNIHDIAYKRLFGNKSIFRQLIETFVEEDWVQELDFDQATRLDKSFGADHYKETESDIIYRVPSLMADGTERDVYFYILVEFQSGITYLTILEKDRQVCNSLKKRLNIALSVYKRNFKYMA